MNKARITTGNLRIVLLIIAAAAAFIIIPAAGSDYILTVVDTVLIYFLGSIGISLLMGMGGHLSFATISFMGIGAFLAAQMSKNYGIAPVLAVPLAVIMTAAAALVIGLMLLRLSGSFFLFATIAFAQIMANVFLTFRPLSNGADGVYNIPKLSFLGIEFNSLTKWFRLLMVIVVIVALIVERIRRTVLGRSLMSVRDDEVAAKTFGVNVYRTKVIAFVIANTFAALGGALLAFHNGAVSASLFTFEISQRFLVMVMLGGVNSTVGTLVGTFVVTMLPEWLRPVQMYLNIFFGAGLILMMVYMPMGLMGLLEDFVKRIRNRKSVNERKEQEDHADHAEN